MTSRQYCNDTGVLLTTLTGAGAGTVNTPDLQNMDATGLMLVIDVTVAGGTPTLTVTIEGKDEISGKYFPLLVSAAIAAVSTTVLRIFPGSDETANLRANIPLPRHWRVSSVVGGGTPAVTATIVAYETLI